MRVATVLVAVLLTGALAANAVAEPRMAEAKKCFKKKKGKRVRVKCPKKKTTPAKPVTPPPAPVPMSDPVAIGELSSLVSGQMLHQFATSSFPGEQKLYLCGDGTYLYVATLDPELAGLAGLGKTAERGIWRVTGAVPAGEAAFDGGLLLLPGDGTAPHLAKLSAQRGSEAVIAFVNGTQWYASPATVCGPA